MFTFIETKRAFLRNFVLILFVLPSIILAKEVKLDEDKVSQQLDSSRISHILSVDYENDTVIIKALHFSICCDKFVVYDDVNVKGKKITVNLVYKNYERDCLCMCERVVIHKVYLKEFRMLEFKFDGADPELGITEFKNPNIELTKKEIRRANKNKL